MLVALGGAKVEIEVPLASIGNPTAFRFECVGENAAVGSNAGIDFAVGQFSVVAPQSAAAPLTPIELRPMSVDGKGSSQPAGVDSVRAPFVDPQVEQNRGGKVR
jgi:hypothetical protein